MHSIVPKFIVKLLLVLIKIVAVYNKYQNQTYSQPQQQQQAYSYSHSVQQLIQKQIQNQEMPKNKKRQQDSDQSDDSQDSELKVNTDNSPKIIPVAKLPEKLKQKKIVINISDTQYPIIEEVAESLGWIIQNEEGVGDWDIWWTDRQIQPNTLFKMNLYQKINHFPGIYVLARKNLLGLHLMAMKRKFPNQYNFFPDTWIVPMQFPQFRQYFQSVDEGKTRTYIVKPQALSQGRGIFLTRSIEDILNGRKYVIQRYLKNPMLIQGLKFDLRIYVLLAGSEPLRLYVYEEGLVRLATQQYQTPTAQNLSQSYIHLTNYSLNKSNPNYVFNKSDKQLDVGHKRSLKAVYERMAKNGINIQKIKNQIDDCIIKTVISGLPSIRHQYKYCQPQQYEGNMCFHILGFDVMLLDDYTPIVIQVNHTPSFETSTPLDYQIKKSLITDTLQLMRITPKEKKNKFNKSKQLSKARIQTGKRDIFKGQKRKEELQRVQKIRDEHQQKILTNEKNQYRKIFPFQDQQKNKLFQKFYQGAQQVMKQEKDMRKRIINEQKQTENKYKKQQKKVSSLRDIKDLKKNTQKKQSSYTKILANQVTDINHSDEAKDNTCQNNSYSNSQQTNRQKSAHFRTKINRKSSLNSDELKLKEDIENDQLNGSKRQSNNFSNNEVQKIAKNNGLQEIQQTNFQQIRMSIQEIISNQKDDQYGYSKLKLNMVKKIQNLINSPIVIKDSKYQRGQVKFGTFLKPKTYNLHQNRLPHDQRFIVRSSPSPHQNMYPFIQYQLSPPQSVNNYSNYLSNLNNVNHQGYTSKNKDVNSKNMGINSKVNASGSSNKVKSSSYSYKNPSNNPVLLKLIDRTKVKGYM